MSSPKKVDANQKDIVLALRQAGCTVFDTHAIGKGFPDIVVGHHGKNYLLEIKSGKGKLTGPEVVFYDTWRGSNDIVRTVEEALKSVGLLI